MNDGPQERKVFEMSLDDKMKACEAFRTHGNAFFKEGMYSRACGLYEKVLTHT